MLNVNDAGNISAMKTFLGNAGNIIKNGGTSLNSIFEQADANKDGKLDNNEVSNVLKQWNMESTYSSDTVMQAVDGDKDGSISMSEIINYAKSLGVDLKGENSLLSNLFNIGKMGGGLGNLMSGILGFASGNNSAGSSGAVSNQSAAAPAGFSAGITGTDGNNYYFGNENPLQYNANGSLQSGTYTGKLIIEHTS